MLVVLRLPEGPFGHRAGHLYAKSNNCHEYKNMKLFRVTTYLTK